MLFRSGEVAAVEAYDPKETDFSIGIKKVVGLFYPRPELDMEEEELEEYEIIELESEDEPEPIIDFDAIFIPDSFERVALIAPQLAYHDVVGVRLLGTNLWNSPKLMEIAGEYVRGAVFPAGFFSRGGYEGTKKFVELYNSYFGHEPGFLAALGYDTVRLVKEIVRKGNADIKTREDLHYVLTTTNDFNGLHGAMFFDQNRVAKRDAILLTILGRHFFPVP